MNADVKQGRPKKYPTAFELEVAVDMYFFECDETFTPYTYEGLAHTLDVDRKTLWNYEHDEADPERRRIVRNAKHRVVRDMVERGLTSKKNPALTIFLLKNNFGYVDKTEHEVNNKIDIQQITGAKITPE